VPAKTLDLNLLPIAFALYDELSVSRAARLLGMSQPAVSMALRRMRESFDDPQPRGREAHPKDLRHVHKDVPYTSDAA
jgi:predicted transcriptional regulator